MRSLRINGMNAHDIQVQNNVDIYKRLILNRKKGDLGIIIFMCFWPAKQYD